MCVDLGKCDSEEDISQKRMLFAHEHVDAFDDVEKDFVFAVSDALCSPRNRIRDGHGRTGLDLEFVGLLSDVSERMRGNERYKRRLRTLGESCSLSSVDIQSPSSRPSARK